MGGKAHKPVSERQADWCRRIIQHYRFLLIRVFPIGYDYDYSLWASWEERIRQGHCAEEQWLNKTYNEHEVNATSDPSCDLSDVFAEDYIKTYRLTNSMYAALVVGIWSEMEHFLKDVISLYYRATEKRKRILERTKRFCEDCLNQNLPETNRNATLHSCVKLLKQLQAGIPHEFDKVKSLFREEMGIEMNECAEYVTVDIVRVLNNAFKHSRGCWHPNEGQSHIDEALRKKWSVLGCRNEIDYAKLPVRQLVFACNAFCTDLLIQMESQFQEKVSEAE